MRKSNLLKKGIAVLLALALVGLFASCKNDAGGEKKTYTIAYDGITLYSELDQEDYDDMKSSNMFTENTDYTISGTTITLTDAGLEKFFDLMAAEMAEDPDVPEDFEIAAFVVYPAENFITPIDAMSYAYAATLLEEDTDYTLKANGKIVVLTDAGWTKAATLFSDSGED